MNKFKKIHICILKNRFLISLLIRNVCCFNLKLLTLTRVSLI